MGQGMTADPTLPTGKERFGAIADALVERETERGLQSGVILIFVNFLKREKIMCII